jgi:hypothetical protein
MAILNPEHAAVFQLQQAARAGRAVMIPGALEPARHPAIEVVQVKGPRLDPVTDHHDTGEHDREAGGTPAAPVTLFDRLGLIGLRATELLIRLLATPARFTGM